MAIDAYTVRWIADWLKGCTQRVVVDGSYSTWGEVGSGVPQSSVLGPMLFNQFISELDNGVKSNLFKFTDDTKIWGEVSTLVGRERLQQDLDRLQEWADINKTRFNTDKRRVLHLSSRNQQHTYRMGNSHLESTETERDLGVIIDSKMDMG